MMGVQQPTYYGQGQTYQYGQQQGGWGQQPQQGGWGQQPQQQGGWGQQPQQGGWGQQPQQGGWGQHGSGYGYWKRRNDWELLYNINKKK